MSLEEDYKDALDALQLMAMQYLGDDNGNLDHRYMAAGESCLECLAKEGFVTGSGRAYRFSKKSEYWGYN